MEVTPNALIFLSLAFALIFVVLADGGSSLECSNLPDSCFHSNQHYSLLMVEVSCNFGQKGLHTERCSAFRCLSIALVAYGGEGLQRLDTEQYLTFRCLDVALVVGEGYEGDYGWGRTETESKRQLDSCIIVLTNLVSI